MYLKKTIIVTGSTSGIGLAITQKFYDEYFNCIIVGKAKSSIIKKLKKKFSESRSLILNLDLTKTNNVKKLISLTVKKFKKIDVLVNCAGMQLVSSLEKYPEDTWKKLIDINLNAAFYMTKYTLPEMRKNNWGRIINIASTHGLIGSINKSAYTASKHAVIGLTKSFAVELGRHNITVNAVCPGPIDTAMTAGINDEAKEKYARRKVPLRRYGIPEEVAHMTLNLSLPASSFVNGAAIVVDGGMSVKHG